MIPLLFVQAQGAAPAGSPAGPSLMVFLVEVIAIVAIFYFLLVRPQSKERKRQEQTRMELKRGDEVVTAGGVIGEVIHIQLAPAAEGKDAAPSMVDRITIRSGESKFIIERAAIARVAPKGS